MNIAAALTDASHVSGILTTPIRASLSDNTTLTADLTVLTPVHLLESFADESMIRAALLHFSDTGIGPFYFAWATEDETPFNASLLRDDEDIFSFTLTQEEGDFAHLSIVVKNPRVGLLAPTRKVWAWLSYYDGTTTKPLFFGRLVGIPTNVFDTKVTLDFIARPTNFAAQKEVLAATMRSLPYYDPLFISPDSWDDPDVVLEARTQMWHVDRVTHVLTTSDVLVPEDGTIELTEDDHLYDGLATSLSTTPLRRVQVVAQIPWTQTAYGTVSLTKRVLNAWPKADSRYSSQFVASYTFEGLSGDWPRPGAKFGQGWTVDAGSLIDQSAVAVPLVDIPDWQLKVAGYSNPFTDQSGNPISTAPQVVWGSIVFVVGWQYTNVGFSGVDITVVPIGWGIPELIVSYDASRDFSEMIIIDLETDMQSIVTLPGDDELLVLNINANSASAVTRDGSIPMRDHRANAFASTPRGQSAIEHLTLLGRANLINRSRAVRITCAIKNFVQSFDISLRKGLLIHDHRLPGGQAIGKVTEFTLSYTGGRPTASVTISSAVGYGGSVVTNDGEDAYIDDTYIDDYYVRDGSIIALPSSDVTYTPPQYTPNDDGIDFMRGLDDGRVLQSIVITGGPTVQAAAINAYSGPSLDAIGVVLQDLPTQVHVDILPIGTGPYTTYIPVSVSKLIVPKQIDLEAAS